MRTTRISMVAALLLVAAGAAAQDAAKDTTKTESTQKTCFSPMHSRLLS